MQINPLVQLARNVERKYVAMLLVWSSLIATSLAWNIRQEVHETITTATSIARTTINKDIAFHKWVTSHGGIYVSPSDKTPANPYLKSLKRDGATDQGKDLILMNPAYALRELQKGEDAGARTHISNLKPLNPDNAADIWEKAALERFAAGEHEIAEVVPSDAGAQLRLMMPFVVEKDCLTCHAKQGFVLGEFRGGISSTVALAGFLEDEHQRMTLPVWSHGIIWLFGLLGGGLLFRHERKLLSQQLQSEQQLVEREALFRNYFELGQLGMCITSPDHQWLRVNTRLCEMLGYTQAELSTMTWSMLTHPDDLDADLVQFNQLMRAEIDRYDMDKRFIAKNGKTIYTHLTVSCQRNASGNVDYAIASLDDITARKKAEEEIKNLAMFDPLTGLANRRLLTQHMEHTLALAHRTGELAVVCMVDLDGFKQVNDQMGHKTGDLLLIEVAKRLQINLRQTDTASRFGGDEFALLLGGFKLIDECEQSLKRIVASLAVPYQVNGQIAHVSGSVGATIFPNDAGTPDLLLRHADQSMYEAKQAGKNCYRMFNPSHHKQQLSNQTMLKKIGRALDAGQFTLYYQPQVNCVQGMVVAMEALIRWNHPVLGLLGPSEFIPLLESDDLIVGMGEWVLHQALQQQVAWKQAGFDLSVSVNIAARQLHQLQFISRLTELIHVHGADAVQHLTLEIVENTALDDIDRVATAIRQCRELGIHVAIGDFGTGFSSLAHLTRLHVDEIKIDKSFVAGMLQCADDLAIVRGVIGLAASFQHALVAEGVESIEQILLLIQLACPVVQGFAIAHPVPAEQTIAWLSNFQPDPLWRQPG